MMMVIIAMGLPSCGDDDNEPLTEKTLALTTANLESNGGQYHQPWADGAIMLTFYNGMMQVEEYKAPSYKFVHSVYGYTVSGDSIIAGRLYTFHAELKEQVIDGSKTTYLIISGLQLPPSVKAASYIKGSF